MRIFTTGSILLPKSADMTRWSVVACDQFTSEPEYWQAADALVGSAPSTLRLIEPEAFLHCHDLADSSAEIERTMSRYLTEELFQTAEDSYVYLERTLPDGTLRQGLVGCIDLDAYDFSKASVSPVRATEATVEDRLPPRVEIRRRAALELPHIMVFIDDPARAIIEPLATETDVLPKLYDFDLMAGGGHIRGWRVSGSEADALCEKLDALSDSAVLEEKYGADCGAPVIYAMGDGNHSLAAAKLYWQEVRAVLTEDERKSHPARFALVELVNIHSRAIRFEPIHRLIYDSDGSDLIECAEHFFSGVRTLSGGHAVTFLTAGAERTLRVEGRTIGQLIADCDRFCTEYTAIHGGKVDYIHGDDVLRSLGGRPGCGGILLPTMTKPELFPSVMRSGAFPKKSFSIGHARDKRYYLECRRLK